MALEPGTRFGSFEVIGPIGSGGMGEVYRATDTTLKRDVALKVLPPAFVEDSDRLARFRREAEILASLNHPNIANIHGLERTDDQTVIVMELVEGPTLEDRIRQRTIPLDEAMDIALQIIAALEAAHARQIVHRDLKPANIKIRDDGTVKVLDFGISKSIDPRAVDSAPAATTPVVTQAGVILGTAAYMSPEQARGKLVDQRSDIWAFGCVLYEILTGQLAFGGDDSATTLARVLERGVNLDLLPKKVPAAVRKTIELCLEKDVRKRIADIRDVRLMLTGPVIPKDQPGRAGSFGVRKSLMIAAGGILMGGIVAGFVAVSLWPVATTSPVSVFDWDIPVDQSLRATGRSVVALSPDGRNLVYNTTDGLRLRPLDALDTSLIAGTNPLISSPVFSPDGQSVAYFELGSLQLKRVPVSGGAPVSLAAFDLFPYGISWHQNGTILVGQPDGVYRVPDTGGEPERVIEIRQEELLYGPQLLPDGDSVLFSATTDALDWDNSQVYVESLSTGVRTAIDIQGGDVRYLPSGHLVYAVGDALFAKAFDLESLDVSGGAVPITQGLMRATANTTAAANYGVSDTGMLAYLSGRRSTQMHTLVWVDRDGIQAATGLEPGAYTSVRLSPDDTRVALDTFGAEMDIWTSDLSRASLQKVTRGRTINAGPLWTPDSGRLVWSRAQTSAMQEVFGQSADGSGTPQLLTVGSHLPVMPTAITPDGEFLLFSQFIAPRDVLMVSMSETPSAGINLIATDADETNATVSPDGRWLAYQSNENGKDEIWVRPFPDVNASREQVSNDGGTRPVWSDDGTELFYYVNRGEFGAFMSVAYESGDSFVHDAPVELFRGPYFPPVGLAAASNSFYDVTRDGQRFLIIRSAAGDGSQPAYDELPRIIFVENWFVDAERL